MKPKATVFNLDLLPQLPGHRRVLVAEENITSQKVLLGILRKLGCRADAVATGPAALKQLERIPYDLLLLAVRLPEQDDVKAAAAVRAGKMAGAARLPIIAVAARGLNWNRDRCLAAGMDDYISKPVDPRVIAEKLAKWLAAKPEEKPALDVSLLRERLLGDAEMAGAVLAVFAEDLPLQLAELENNFKKSDAGALRKGGHKLKGSAANVGAEVLRALGAELENAGARGDLGAAAVLLPRLAAAAAQVLEQIRGCAGAAKEHGAGEGGG